MIFQVECIHIEVFDSKIEGLIGKIESIRLYLVDRGVGTESV